MEFIVSNKKYSILNHELYINYLMVNEYFRKHSKYDYDITFEFLNPLLSKDRIDFDDIMEGTRDLEVLIEKEEISFIPAGLSIDEQMNGKFRISYQSLEFRDVNVGEAIPLLVALTSLLNHRPIVSLYQIGEELDYFLVEFRKYNDDNGK